MATLLEKVTMLATERERVERDFRAALIAAKEVHSWAELAVATGLSPGGVRHLVLEGRERNGSSG